MISGRKQVSPCPTRERAEILQETTIVFAEFFSDATHIFEERCQTGPFQEMFFLNGSKTWII